jgi:hypothetical protein
VDGPANGPQPVCPSCGAPHAPRQEYCLDCGARIVSVPHRTHWMWPSLGALVIAAAGAVAAIAATSGGAHGSTQTVIATQALVALPPERTPPARRTPKPARSPIPAHTGGLTTWPGGNRYTIVLGSLPAPAGFAAARARAQQAVRAGLANVGVLVSSSYSSLHPGYYVIFSGVYDTLEDAQGALPEVAPRFPSAFAQQIAR